MTKKRVIVLGAAITLVAVAVYAYVMPWRSSVTLTGVVTTHDVIVSPQVAGQIEKLLVKEGDTVTKGQLLAVIATGELRAEASYYGQNAAGMESQVRESEAALRLQEQQTKEQIQQARAALASTEAQVEASAAELERARLTHARDGQLHDEGVVSAQELDAARTAAEAAQANLAALKKQVDVQRAALELALSNAEQVAIQKSRLAASQHLREAAAAQRAKAEIRLGYAELRAPIDGIVDVRAVRAGEFVAAGQPVVTLVDPDDLWVRVDVEESAIDSVRLGDTLTVRLPSGAERQGKVIYRGVDAGFATQRDVSRTKRDIKTFEVRLRVDNSDRRLALGMTAFALLPVS